MHWPALVSSVPRLAPIYRKCNRKCKAHAPVVYSLWIPNISKAKFKSHCRLISPSLSRWCVSQGAIVVDITGREWHSVTTVEAHEMLTAHHVSGTPYHSETIRRLHQQSTTCITYLINLIRSLKCSSPFPPLWEKQKMSYTVYSWKLWIKKEIEVNVEIHKMLSLKSLVGL